MFKLKLNRASHQVVCECSDLHKKHVPVSVWGVPLCRVKGIYPSLQAYMPVAAFIVSFNSFPFGQACAAAICAMLVPLLNSDGSLMRYFDSVTCMAPHAKRACLRFWWSVVASLRYTYSCWNVLFGLGIPHFSIDAAAVADCKFVNDVVTASQHH